MTRPETLQTTLQLCDVFFHNLSVLQRAVKLYNSIQLTESTLPEHAKDKMRANAEIHNQIKILRVVLLKFETALMNQIKGDIQRMEVIFETLSKSKTAQGYASEAYAKAIDVGKSGELILSDIASSKKFLSKAMKYNRILGRHARQKINVVERFMRKVKRMASTKNRAKQEINAKREILLRNRRGQEQSKTKKIPPQRQYRQEQMRRVA